MLSIRKPVFSQPLRGIGVAFVLVAIIAFSGCSTNRTDDSGPPSKPPTIVVQTVPVVMTDFERAVTVTGSVAPELRAMISTRAVGRVQRVLVKEGDAVRKDEPLIQLDSADLDAAVSQARADVDAAQTQVGNAQAALSMEQASSPAHVDEAQAKVAEALAALKSAQAQRDIITAGPRRQERRRAEQSVVEADASLVLARNTYDRMSRLYDREAITAEQLDQTRSALDEAEAQYQSAVLAKNQTDEGSRPQEIRAATDAVGEATAKLNQAKAGLIEAQAGTLAVDLRRADVAHAQSGVAQARAELAMAVADRAYATIRAPFDGVVTARSVDPGAMAGPGVPLLTIEGGSMRLESNVPETAVGAARAGSFVDVTLAGAPDRPLSGRVISLAEQGDTGSHTFLAKIELPGGSGAVSGMYGSADLSVGIDRHPAVPSSSLVSRDGLNYVYVVGADHVARLRFVTTGAESAGKVPVLSGVDPGERVIARNVESVKDAAIVDDESRVSAAAPLGARG